jgi:tetratricopeptide (TPR) repeat protein
MIPLREEIRPPLLMTCLVLFVGLTFVLRPDLIGSQEIGARLTLAQILDLHRNEVPCRPLAARIAERGINFDVTPDVMSKLKAAQICDQAITEMQRRGAELARLKKEEEEKKKISEDRDRLEKEKQLIEDEKRRTAEIAKLRDSIRTGNSYLDQGLYAEATSEFEKARAMGPTNKEVLAGLDRAARAREAEATVPKGKPLSLDDIKGILIKGITSRRAATLIEKLGVNFELTPDGEEDLKKRGANEQAIIAIQKKGLEFAKERPGTGSSRDTKPTTEQVRLVNLGAGMIRQQKYQEALEQSERALKLNTAYDKAWDLQGDALRGLKRFGEAVTSYDRALAINPVDAFVWSKKALALTDLSRHEEAVQSFERALDINPTNATLWAFKGNSLLAIKRCNEARISYDKAVELDPGLNVRLHDKFEQLKNCGT